MKEKKLEIWDWFEADMLILDFPVTLPGNRVASKIQG